MLNYIFHYNATSVSFILLIFVDDVVSFRSVTIVPSVGLLAFLFAKVGM